MIHKQWFSKLVALVLVASAALLSGCGEDAPAAKLVQKEIETISGNDAAGLSKNAFKVADLVRENGWKDQDKYLVKYTYNLESITDYDNVFVAMLKQHVKEIKEMSEEDRNSTMMSVGLGSMMNSMISAQEKQTQYVRNSQPIQAYIREYSNENRERKDANALLGIALYTVHATLSEYKVPMGAAQGNKIPRQVTMTFRKTEKGWARFN